MLQASTDKIATEPNINSPIDCCKELGIPIACLGFCGLKRGLRRLDFRLESGAVVESIATAKCVKHMAGIIACRNGSKYSAVNRISIFLKDFCHTRNLLTQLH